MFGNVLIAPVIINRLTASNSTKKLLWQVFLKEFTYFSGTFFTEWAMNSWFYR